VGSLKLGLIGDPGGSRYNSSRFYYFPGGGWLRKSRSGYGGANINVNASGPAQQAVAELIRSKQPDGILALGDLVYNTGASSLFDDEVGRLFNDFIAPYPSPRYSNPNSPYRHNAGNKVWPYDIYNTPWGYPNPVNGEPQETMSIISEPGRAKQTSGSIIQRAQLQMLTSSARAAQQFHSLTWTTSTGINTPSAHGNPAWRLAVPMAAATPASTTK
jgi:hypothetical protein